MTKENRKRLSEHFRKLGVKDPYSSDNENTKKKDAIKLPPLPPPIVNPPEGDPGTEEGNPEGGSGSDPEGEANA